MKELLARVRAGGAWSPGARVKETIIRVFEIGDRNTAKQCQ